MYTIYDYSDAYSNEYYSKEYYPTTTNKKDYSNRLKVRVHAVLLIRLQYSNCHSPCAPRAACR